MEDQVNVVQEPQGTITFANEVLATIIGVAACDIPGVAGMCGGFKDGIVDMLGKKNLSKGVKVAVKQNVVSVDIAIVVDYGVCVPEVCGSIQDSVKKAVETMTGLEVGPINISIEGLSFKDEEAQTK